MTRLKTQKGPWTDDVSATETEAETAPLSVRAVILETCRTIAVDNSAPHAARVQAARTLAEMAGLIGKVQSGALDTGETREAEMLPDDIDREIARLRSTSSRAK